MNAPAWLTARPIAHRGLHDATAGVFENTLSAAEAAVRGGFAIECDVQLTADDEAVVFHDHSLDRLTTETGEVRTRSTDALTRLAIRGTADRIPTLADFLARIGGRVPLVVEIKSRFDGDLRLTARACAVLKDYGGPVAVKSFDPAIVAELRRIAPDLPRGIVAEAEYADADWSHLSPETRRGLAALTHFPATEPDFISWRVRDLPHGSPFLCRHLGGRPVMTWTVRTETDRQRAQEHADQIVFEGFDPNA